MASIYLSSTYADLKDHREEVYHTLRQMRHDVISMEDYGATDQRPLDKCLDDVRSCDIYVGLFAWRYGYLPPNQGKAITELEFREAVRSGKTCLIFLLSEEAPWPRTRMDEDSTAIVALRNELQRDYIVAFFDSADELSRAVSVAVTNACNKLFSFDTANTLPQDTSRLNFYRDCLGRYIAELGSQIRFYLLSSTALLTFGLIVLLVGFLVAGNQVLGIGGMLISSFMVFPLATMYSARRKKVVLDGYQHALLQDQPATEALLAVQQFMDRQLAS